MSELTRQLDDQIRHVMDSFVKENDIEICELVGVLEAIKYSLLNEYVGGVDK